MLQIQQAKTEHTKSIILLWKELMNIHKDFDNSYFLEMDNNIENYVCNIQLSIINDNERVIVAVKDELVVGYITAEVNLSSNFMYNSNAVCTVNDIMILPNYQHLGIGKALIEEIKIWAKSNDINQLELNVFSKNKNALKFFKNQGFEDQFNKLELKF